MPIKLMLADKTDGKGLAYPLLASPKLDGVRATVQNGVLLSRNDKEIPNIHTQQLFGNQLANNLDGELIVGEPWAADCFRKTTSGVMSVEGEPDVSFHVFDMTLTNCRYKERMGLFSKTKLYNRSCVRAVPQELVTSYEDLMVFEERMLEIGYEGVMLRDPQGFYKNGRCGQRDPWLLKLKRFEDSEALVLKLVEQMENTNAAIKDSLGRSKRSSHKAGKKGKDTTGALKVRDIHTGVEFEVGTGFDHATARRWWVMPHIVVGKTIKYKYFPTGSKDKPRFPVFLGFRDKIDL